MATPLPVAGLTLGDLSRFGVTSVANAAATIAPPGWQSSKVSFQSSVYYDGQTGSTVWFAFDAEYAQQTALNTPFVFGGEPPVSAVSAGVQTKFGVAQARNSAFDFTPTSWGSSKVGKAIVWNYVENAGAGRDFLFADAYTTPDQINTPFYFGGQIAVGGVSLGVQTRFGLIEDIEKPLQISPFGKESSVKFGRPRVGDQPAVEFLFVDEYNRPTTYNVPFYFGGGISAGVGGDDYSKFGLSDVVNSAKSADPVGWQSSKFGRFATYFKGENGAGVNFVFAQDYNGQTPLNTPFYFAGLTGINVGSVPPGAVGDIHVTMLVDVPSIDGEIVAGDPVVAFGIGVGGWNEGAYGTATITSFAVLQFTGFTSEGLGTSIVADPDEFSPFGVADFTFNPPPYDIRSTTVHFRFDRKAVNTIVSLSGLDSERIGAPTFINVFTFRDRIPYIYQPVTQVDFSFQQVEDRVIDGLGWESAEFGSVDVSNFLRFVEPSGWSTTATGTPQFSNIAYIGAYGLGFYLWGNTEVYNVNNDGFGKIPPGEIGGFRVDYRIKGKGFTGFDQDVLPGDGFGKVAVSPQFVRPVGWTGGIGTITFDQTLTTRTVKPSGFSSYAFSTGVKVNPRFVYPVGYLSIPASARFGLPRLARNALEVLGIYPNEVGVPRVDDGKQFITVPAYDLDPVQVPQPDVDGYWEFVLPVSVAEAGVFGDTAVRNAVEYVLPEGFDASEFPAYQPNVYNYNQLVLPFGWLSPGAFYARPYVYNAAWQIIPAQTIGPETFGPETDVGEFIKYVYPFAYIATIWGTSSIRNAARVVAPPGITGAFGSTLVAEGRRYIAVPSFGDTLFGEGDEDAPVVGFGLRYLRDVGGSLMSIMSTNHVVESTLRYIDHGTFGEDMSSYGTNAIVWFRVRNIVPASIAYQVSWLQFGGEVKVEFKVRYIDMQLLGRDSLVFGATEVRRNEFVVEPPGLTGEIGEPNVEWYRRPVFARTIFSDLNWGMPWVSASPRYIEPFVDENTRALMGGVGEPWNVENGNKTITNYGWESSRFPLSHFVYNNARIVAPQGSDTSIIGTAFVADAIRTVQPVGWDSAFFHQWNEVYNYAQVLELPGIPRLHVGIPYVWSNTQWVDLYGSDNDHTEWGAETFVAFAIRTITFEQQEGALQSGGIPPGDIGVHYMDNYSRYVYPPGLIGGVGDHFVETKFSIIKPWGSYMAIYGEALVKNVTPEVKIFPWGSSEFPHNHYVGLYTRTIDQSPHAIPPPHEFLPRPVVEFRTKRVTFPGIDSLRIPLLHRVWIDEPEVPPLGKVFPRWFAEYNSETQAWEYDDPAGYGTPSLRVMPKPEGWVSSRFGQTWVRAQGIMPIWDDFTSVFGYATLNPTQYITQDQEPIIEAHGLARLSPFTIYCRPDFPPNYDRGMPPRPASATCRWWGPWTNVDVEDRCMRLDRVPPQEDVQWGRALVTTFEKQRITVFHDQYSTATGEIIERWTTVANRKRWIYPEGIPPPRFGYPELPTAAEIFAGNFRTDRYGEPTVTRGVEPPSDRTVSASGSLSQAFGVQHVENYHRTIYPSGKVMTSFGNNNPMVYRYPRGVFDLSGGDLLLWGTARVEFKDRSIYPQGDEFFISDYEVQFFNDRMKVFRKTNPMYPLLGDLTEFGTTEVQLKTQMIYPYQIPAPRCLGEDIRVLEEVK